MFSKWRSVHRVLQLSAQLGHLFHPFPWHRDLAVSAVRVSQFVVVLLVLALTTSQPALARPTAASVGTATALGTQSCGIEGVVYDHGKPAAGIRLELVEYSTADRSDEVVRDRTITFKDGTYRFEARARLGAVQRLYVRYRNARSGSPLDLERLSAYYGPDIKSVDSDGCAHGGNFDIGDVEVTFPPDDGWIFWGEPFHWKTRVKPASLQRDRFQICFTDWDRGTLIGGCIPRMGVGGTQYAPTGAERPNGLVSHMRHGWHMKIWHDDGSWGEAQFRFPFRISTLPTPGTPTYTPTPTLTPTPVFTPVPDAIKVCPGDSITGDLPVFIPPQPGQADIIFAFDTTSSMSSVNARVRASALDIMDEVAKLIPDVRFAVVEFQDHRARVPYRLHQPLTADRSKVAAALGRLGNGSRGNVDSPEAYSRALYEAYADPAVGWRSDGRRLMITFGDMLPHDDNLNEDIPNPPRNPGGAWCYSPPCEREAGRDGLVGTGDDIDLQETLDELNRKQITLLQVVAKTSYDSDMVRTYWDHWAKRTYPGGSAVTLDDSDELPKFISDLVKSAGVAVGRVELVAEPARYATWLTADPPYVDNVKVTGDGLQLHFKYTITVPKMEPSGHTHRVGLVVRGGGAEYARRVVPIYVKPCRPPATPVPAARAVALAPEAPKQRRQGVFEAIIRWLARRGPAGGYVNALVMAQNTDGGRVVDADLEFRRHALAYEETLTRLAPIAFLGEMRGIPVGGAEIFNLMDLGVDVGDHTVVVQRRWTPHMAFAVRLDWLDTGATALYSNASSSSVLSVPLVLRKYVGQSSVITVMADGNARPVDVELTIYERGSDVPASPPVLFRLHPFEGMSFDLLDNIPSFNALGSNFVGSATIRAVYAEDRTDDRALLAGVSFINMERSDRAVTAFEAIPSAPHDTRASNVLYAPLWRSRHEPSSGVFFDTGLSVMNPNDRAVEVVAEFFPSQSEHAPAACRNTSPFTKGPYRIEPRSSVLIYQGPGGEVYPRNCFGSAELRGLTASDTFHALVVDSMNEGETASAYTAVPIEQTHTRVGAPYVRSEHTAYRYSTGIQAMNVSQEWAEVRVTIMDSSGARATPIQGCKEQCVKRIPPKGSATWWPPNLKVKGADGKYVNLVPNGTLTSATIESTQPVAVIVNDNAMVEGVDSATYNGIPLFDMADPLEP